MSTTASLPNRSAVELLAEELDPSPEHLRIADERYADLGEWLRAHGDFPFEVEVYPQGSRAIGTTNRDPRTGRFDIDCVVRVGCERRDQVTQEELNTMVGERLRRYAWQRRREGHRLAPRDVEDKRRAWTLGYADGLHMDVLPVIPDDRTSARVGDPSLLTDKEFVRWLRTNPRGFADWFRRTDEQERRRLAEAAAKERDVTVEDLPDSAVKTALQRAVQLVKRHRDLYFGDVDVAPPPSVMVTTVAARAYASVNAGGPSSLEELVRAVVEGMGDHVEVDQNGRLAVPNPVDLVDDATRENFADRLNEDHDAVNAFWEWMDRIRADLGDVDAARPDAALKVAERGFGVEAARLAHRLGVDPPPSPGAAHAETRESAATAPGWKGRQRAPRESTERYA